MATTSTNALTSQLRTHLLTWTAPAGTPLFGTPSLGTRLGARFYKDWPPENASFPYAVARLINRISGGENQQPQYKEKPALEIMLYDNSRAASRVDALEDMGDVIDAAMMQYVDSSSGLTFNQGRQRDTLPPPVSPADRHSNSIRFVFDFSTYPLYLTSYAT